MKRFKYLTLAALVAFAACDEGEPIAPATGTVSGVVTIEGTGASGVTVELSSGQTATTDASGAYSFTDVSTGAYTVSISNLPSDATFSSTSQGATISSAGQVVTVNFDGDFVRTSAILGSVAAGGSGLEGVTVSIGGGNTTTTDVNGQYAFTGLRAGDYTVSISGFDAVQYTFAETSKDVTVGTGESQSVPFQGTLAANAVISGSLFIDENPDDGIYSTASEEKLAVEGITVTATDGTIPVFDTTTTDANGDFQFTDLPAGFYSVEIDPNDPGIPGNLAFAGSSSAQNVDLNAGESESVFWGYQITQQAIEAAAFYGVDGVNPGVAPRSGVAVRLFARESHATAGTPVLASDTTMADGTVTFRFDRSADTGPGGMRDGILFAEVRPATLPADHRLNGEQLIEIRYEDKDSLSMAQDTFDVRALAFDSEMTLMDLRGNPLENWVAQLFTDTTAAAVDGTMTDEDGVASFSGSVAAQNQLPVTYFVRTRPGGQPAGLPFESSVIAGDDGMVANSRYLRFDFDGVTPIESAIDAGMDEVTFLAQEVVARIHHEQDDSTGLPTFTGGDDFDAVDVITEVQLYLLDEDGERSDTTWTNDPGPINPAASGLASFTGTEIVPNGSFELAVRKTNPNQRYAFVSDSTVQFELIGDVTSDSIANVSGNAGFSTFAYKFDSNTLQGTISSVTGDPVAGLPVRIEPADGFVEPLFTDTILTTKAAGNYKLENLRDGSYVLSVADSSNASGPVWSFFDTLTTSTNPSSGTADNDTERLAMRTVVGPGPVNGETSIARFESVRMNTSIRGVVVNDIDDDNTTIDPGEAFAGVTIELIEDEDGDGVIDSGESVAMTATTDASGAYTFSPLREGMDWIVRAVSPADRLVLRSLSATGVSTSITGTLTTGGAAGTGAMLNQNMTSQVGNIDPPAQGDELPRWSYSSTEATMDMGGAGAGPNAMAGALTTRPAHFIGLYRNGAFRMTVQDDSDDPVEGVTVTLTLCSMHAPVPTNPVGNASGCDTPQSGGSPYIITGASNAIGLAEFEGLLEGVWQATVAGGGVGFGTNAGLDGTATNGDETIMFAIEGSADVETVDDYEVNP